MELYSKLLTHVEFGVVHPVHIPLAALHGAPLAPVKNAVVVQEDGLLLHKLWILFIYHANNITSPMSISSPLQTTPDSPRLASQLRSSGAPYSSSSSSSGSGDSGWRQHTCSCLAHCDVVARRCSWPEHVLLSTAQRRNYSFNTSNTQSNVFSLVAQF